MSTRGFVGVVIDGEEKITYNHSDSYPESLGVGTLAWIRSAISYHDLIMRQARELRVVNHNSQPTPEDIKALQPYTDLMVSRQSTADWYCLLRRTQGDLRLILEAGYLEDAHEFPQDSLYAEWGYIVNLDDSLFEVYKGFQKAPHTLGRFAQREPVAHQVVGPYYPVALIASWPFSSLPSDDDFLSALRPDEDEA